MGIDKKHIKQLLKSGYLSQDDAAERMKKLGYGYDNSLSNMQTKVFVSPDGTPTIVHRGTKTAKDVVDDALLSIGLGEFGYRHKNAKRVTEKAEKKYGRAADTVGHSLGGFLSEHSGAHGQVITYNKAISPTDIFKKIPHNQTDIRTDRDLVSVLSNTQYGGHRQTIKTGDSGLPLLNFINAHNLSNL